MDYRIHGDDMQFVEVELDPGESAVAKILPMELETLGGELICQKDAFLCAAKGVSVGIAFQRRIGVGLFGGIGDLLDGDR